MATIHPLQAFATNRHRDLLRQYIAGINAFIGSESYFLYSVVLCGISNKY
jgi:acyl-homoserine lactone acylase PvdQ